MDIFNSGKLYHRNPLGAVAAGTAVNFRLSPSENFAGGPRLFIQLAGEPFHEIELERESAGTYTCTFTPQASGVYYYFFDLYEGFNKIYRGALGAGEITTGQGELFQLTVYEKGFSTPESTHGGVFYQIFPDRFFVGKNPAIKEENMPYGRFFQWDKNAVPFFGTDGGAGAINTDYYGGNFAGIEEKLPYLASLGVTHLYLNPIFEAHENHRYNTADYLKADPLLGTNEDFRKLCASARAQGIRIVLDGVFSHTGADSVYFNKYGRYGAGGAYNDENSEYRSWYHFGGQYSGGYRSWWGFDTLPEVREEDEAYRAFIKKVLLHWLDLGAAGFRLDVADELPDDFIAFLRDVIKTHNPQNLLIGEVWEDATNKISYDKRRTYLLGKGLDTVMNYPFRGAMLAFLKQGDAQSLADTVLRISENYPPQALHTLLNFLSTHDTQRIATALVGEEAKGRARAWQARQTLSEEQRISALPLLRLGQFLQFTLPGCPMLYYADEVAAPGYTDPFNRGFYPWHWDDYGLREHIRTLCALRAKHPALQTGAFSAVHASRDLFAFTRTLGDESILCAVNRAWHPQTFTFNTIEYTVNPSSWLALAL